MKFDQGLNPKGNNRLPTTAMLNFGGVNISNQQKPRFEQRFGSPPLVGFFQGMKCNPVI